MAHKTPTFDWRSISLLAIALAFHQGLTMPSHAEDAIIHGSVSTISKNARINHLREYTKRNPRSAQAYFLLGKILHEEQDYTSAEYYYSQALRVNPKMANALTNRALILGRNGKMNEAIKDLNRAIELEPNNSRAYNNRGIARGALNDMKGAIKDFTRAIEIDSRFSQAVVNRGITKEIMGDVKGACSDWEKAQSLGDNDANKWYREQCS